ncbi:MAG: nitrate reductase cytochrome c-type subunit [Burkholderiaceae bacterium]
MKTLNTKLLAALLAAGVLGCTSFAGIASLRGADTATPDQVNELKAYAGKRPGSGAPIERTFKEQPPLVPHAIENFDEITVADNQCLECHGPANYVKKASPKLGDSHLAAAGSTNVRMDRYQCNTCHVPQVDAKPLVTSTFVGTPVPPRKQ